MCIVRSLLDKSGKTHIYTQSTHSIQHAVRQLCNHSDKEKNAAVQLFFDDRLFLPLTSYVYCVWMGSEVATAARFFSESVWGLAESARQSLSILFIVVL